MESRLYDMYGYTLLLVMICCIGYSQSVIYPGFPVEYSYPNYYHDYACKRPDDLEIFGKQLLPFLLGSIVGYIINPAVPSNIWRKCLDYQTVAACNADPDCTIENGVRCVPQASL